MPAAPASRVDETRFFRTALLPCPRSADIGGVAGRRRLPVLAVLVPLAALPTAVLATVRRLLLARGRAACADRHPQQPRRGGSCSRSGRPPAGRSCRTHAARGRPRPLRPARRAGHEDVPAHPTRRRPRGRRRHACQGARCWPSSGVSTSACGSSCTTTTSASTGGAIPGASVGASSGSRRRSSPCATSTTPCAPSGCTAAAGRTKRLSRCSRGRRAGSSTRAASRRWEQVLARERRASEQFTLAV